LKNLRLLFLFFLIFKSQNVFSNNIAVIDIEDIINNNKLYLETLKKIENSQKIDSTFIKDEEQKLEELLKEIDESKLLLSENETNKLINEYNIKFNEFSLKIKEFNDHFQNQIIEIRKVILQEVIVLSEKYAKKNDIDLVIDSTSYLIASNEINMTNIIKEELSKITLKLEFENFEKN